MGMGYGVIGYGYRVWVWGNVIGYGVWGIGYGGAYTHHIADMYKGLDGCYISQFPVKD